MRRMLLLTLGLVTTVPGFAAAAPKPSPTQDLCIVNRSIYTGNALDTLVFQDVQALRPGRTIELKGMYFTPVRIPTPFHGTAVMTTEGTIRIGIYAHHNARNQYDGYIYTSDKTFSGLTDANFAGTLNVDRNGDSLPDIVITFVSEDCATLSIP